MSECTTYARIEMKNEKMAKAAAKRVEEVIRTENIREEYIERFIGDLEVKESDVIVNYSCSLFGDEFEIVMKDIFKAVGEMDGVEEFIAEADWETSSCGEQFFMEANYSGDTLAVKTTWGEDFFGCCDECGEDIVHYNELDGREVFICEECGKELTLEDLFPWGVPEVTEEKIEIIK